VVWSSFSVEHSVVYSCVKSDLKVAAAVVGPVACSVTNNTTIVCLDTTLEMMSYALTKCGKSCIVIMHKSCFGQSEDLCTLAMFDIMCLSAFVRSLGIIPKACWSI